MGAEGCGARAGTAEAVWGGAGAARGKGNSRAVTRVTGEGVCGIADAGGAAGGCEGTGGGGGGGAGREEGAGSSVEFGGAEDDAAAAGGGREEMGRGGRAVGAGSIGGGMIIGVVREGEGAFSWSGGEGKWQGERQTGTERDYFNFVSSAGDFEWEESDF